jgi:hypothetical protein
MLVTTKQALRTVHNYLHIVDKAVDNLERLGNSHSSLVFGESI